MIKDVLLAPFKIVWEIAPPALAIPMVVFMVLIWVSFMVDFEQMVEEDLERESNWWLGGYDPDKGFRYDPDDFD